MIIKLAGGACILFSTVTGCMYLSRQAVYREEALEHTKRALLLLQSCIVYSCMPMEEAMGEIGRKISGSIGLFFQAVSNKLSAQSGNSIFFIWEETLGQMEDKLYLNKEDKQMLLSFGKHLDSPDISHHEGNIRLAVASIDAAKSALHEKRLREDKLYKSLGILGGCMLWIMLL